MNFQSPHWQERTDWKTIPEFYHKAALPLLKEETRLAHNYGAKFGYICTSGIIPMLNAYLDSGIDVLVGVDPVQGTHTDLEILKNKIGHKICLWGALVELPEERFSPSIPTTIGYIVWPLTFIPCALFLLFRIRWKLDSSLKDIIKGMIISMAKLSS